MKKPSKLRNFSGHWAENNIFDFKKHDAFMYLALYVAIPIAVTFLSLKHAADTSIKLVYCYTTILISAAGSLYDAVNRWKSKTKSFLNFKLLFILAPDFIICAYCVVEILSYLIGQTFYVCDYLLCVYFVAVSVALMDFFLCWTREVTLGKILSEQKDSDSTKDNSEDK